MHSDDQTYPSDVAFSPTVKAIQTRKGSRAMYGQMELEGSWDPALDQNAQAFIQAQRSFYLGTASADGQPHVQHRGGPPGFLHIINDRELAFADFRGNRQFISQGNLQDNPKAFIFLMDYAHQARLKIWGEARVIEGDKALIKSLMPEGYRAVAEQAITFKVTLWNWNCRQHIPQRLEVADLQQALHAKNERIAELEAIIEKKG